MVTRQENKVLIVCSNIFVWLVVTIIFHFLLRAFNQGENYFRLIKGLVFLALVFYLNYYLLIPRLLSPRKLKRYAFSVVGFLASILLLNYYLELSLRELLNIPPPILQQTNRNDWMASSTKPIFINFGMTLLCFISLAVSTSIRVTREWFKNENQLKEIENKKLIAELSYLKAQINPHFFFNTLNGIYALARRKSDKTPEVIMMLSVVMRYIIYEASAPKVLLKKEIRHIANFIDLQKLRLAEMVKIDFQVSGSPKNQMIEPLLFTVLVENAFKHGIDYSKSNTIRVFFQIKDEELCFMVSNPVVAKQRKQLNPPEETGIGMENIKKRLDLLYPERHELNVTEKDSLYTVELKLIIDNQVP
ncbi:sensor histidine kinase [Mangrovibacterium sp.]|uniref:sensor histidine kinase n=1 Tax=Mangrovibacterium sp. TaxID=1961364 RepID=UPI0035613945